MEDLMCWEMDYEFFAEQQKALEKQSKEKQIKQQQRAQMIAKLLDEAKTPSEKTEDAPAKEVAPAK
jgi:hypothetical protein